MYKIRNTSVLDAREIYNLDCETYGKNHWSLNSFQSELSNKYSKYLACESKNNNRIIGYAGYWKVGEEGHITTMVVSLKHRRIHVADILLYSIIKTAILNKIKWLTLEVRISNIPAINLYTKFKFNQLGIRKKYYQDNNEDALVFWTNDITTPEYQKHLTDLSSFINKTYDTDILQY